VVLSIAETSFDPAFASDAASDDVIACIMEAMLDYDYLARPVKLVPRTLEALPVMEEGGKLFTMKVKEGDFLTAGPGLQGQAREADRGRSRLRAEADHGPGGAIAVAVDARGQDRGSRRRREKAKKTGKFDYDAPVAGITLIDRHTLKIRLNAADLRFLYVLAVPNTAAMAREVVEAYGNDIGAHPVGTGPYVLGQYKRSSRIELLANPGFREVTYTPAGPIPAASEAVAANLKGKRLPRLPRIDVSIMEEGQARWLAFLSGEVDYLNLLPVNLIAQALDNGKLKPDLVAKGVVHQPLVRPSVAFTYFNMEDPIVGGYEPARIALRRAMGMAVQQRRGDPRAVVRARAAGRAVPFRRTLPATTRNSRPRRSCSIPQRPRRFSTSSATRTAMAMATAKPRRASRWLWNAGRQPTTIARERDELWKKNLDVIGIRVTFKYDKLPELRKMGRKGQIPMRDDGWNADYPDAENFMQLLYGPSVGQANYSRFNLPEFNKLFDEARTLPDSPARTRLFDKDDGPGRGLRAVARALQRHRGLARQRLGPQLRSASDAQRRVDLHGRGRGAAREAQVSASERKSAAMRFPRTHSRSHPAMILQITASSISP
jgi:ABC-type transport system substrate-binding protein